MPKASTAWASEAVTNTMDGGSDSTLSTRATSMPSRPGMRMSRNAASMVVVPSSRTAVAPLSATRTSATSGMSPSRDAISWRVEASSSTTSTRSSGFNAPPPPW